ncbi:MAG: hypothetical protein AAF081_02665 [Actinomycetota bacterium]
MSGPLLRIFRLASLGALASLIAGLIRSARRQPPPPTSGVASWDPLSEEPPAPTRSGPVQFVDTGDATEPTATTEVVSPIAAMADLLTDDEPKAEADEAAEPEAGVDEGAASGWVEPDAEGGCPSSHPIKGNDQSKIFHVPGGMSYERTQAERCYCDEASAEADGYRKAKR